MSSVFYGTLAACVLGIFIALWPALNLSPVQLQGARCLVTGASLGIGKQLAREYADMGVSQLVLVARSTDKLHALRDDIVSSFQRDGATVPVIHVLPADLSNEKTCRDVIENAVELMGGIDYLVLNHITNSHYGLWTTHDSHDFLEPMFQVNTFSYIWLTNAALKSLQESRGQVVVISSFAGYVGVPHTAVYSSTKHALRGFFNALRTELEQYYPNNTVGITICNIGAVDTEGSKEFQSRISVDWIEPTRVARAIIEGAARRQREVYYPLSIYWSVIFHFFCPYALEVILHMTMR